MRYPKAPATGIHQRIQSNLVGVQRQTQGLSATGNLVVKMLSMNACALGEYLRREAERNPCIELVFPQAGALDLTGVLAAAPTDYREELIMQLPGEGDPQVLRAARVLILRLDDAGRLPFDPLRVVEGGQRALLRDALRLVQSLDPPGVGARSLRECLLLQARRRPAPDPDVLALLRDGTLFSLYVQRQFEELCRRLDWPRPRLDGVTAVLRALPIHPIQPQQAATAYVVPDAEICRAGDGTFSVQLMEHALPSVSLNSAYVDSLQVRGTRFANEGLFYANRLIYCLTHRNATLLRVLQFAVERQTELLRGGAGARLPMSDAAGALGLHRSTVSRALSEKHVLHQGRTFPAATLFPRAGKGGVSKDDACRRIRELIAGNDTGMPLSDRALAEGLAARYGITLSRRTVNKYRLSLNGARGLGRDIE